VFVVVEEEIRDVIAEGRREMLDVRDGKRRLQ
jgi:hypothetical protein